jgi:hypothetical protein
MRHPLVPNSTVASHQSDTGNINYPDYGPTLNGTVYPMQSYNGLETRKLNRQPSQSDADGYPWPIRRFTNMSVTDVQLKNGMANGVLSGKRMNYGNAGYLNFVQPIIPGQTRDNAAGYHRRGPSAYNVQDLFTSGPGAQPAHPGGPGKIAAPTFINPMSG